MLIRHYRRRIRRKSTAIGGSSSKLLLAFVLVKLKTYFLALLVLAFGRTFASFLTLVHNLDPIRSIIFGRHLILTRVLGVLVVRLSHWRECSGRIYWTLCASGVTWSIWIELIMMVGWRRKTLSTRWVIFWINLWNRFLDISLSC